MNFGDLLQCLVTFVTALALNGQVVSNGQNVAENPQTRIIGGEEAKLGDFPWQGMFLQKTSPTQASLVCGCSLIYSRWVVTAAHCTINRNANDIVVRFGTVDKYDPEPSAREYEINRIYQHPGYDPDTLINDISLLYVAGTVQYSSYIQPIPLPEQGEQVPVNTSCAITGWGSISNQVQILPLQLMEAEVPVISNNQCARWYLSTIASTQLCAGYREGGIDTCQGDSGGPMACPTAPSSGQFILQGITSFGRGCAEPLSPGVYTRVAEYATWIEDTTGAGNHLLGTNKILASMCFLVCMAHHLFRDAVF